MQLSKKKRLELLRGQLEHERSTFITHWRELGEMILPRRPQFTTNEGNRGDRRNQKIYDGSATFASRTLASGMMSGVTSPARPWFKLTTPDPDLAEFGPVKEWLDIVGRRMASSFLKSNIYNVLPTVYRDLGTFATAPYMVEEHFGHVLHATSFPVGSYMIAKDRDGRVNTFGREFRMTVRQLIEEFGEIDQKTGKAKFDNFSRKVKENWNRGLSETWIDVCHIIKPNDEFDQLKLESKHKKFASYYYEKGSFEAGDEDKFLRVKGYDQFPVLCPRWEVTGSDVYGTDCPGMTALGDIKQLQHGEKMTAEAIVKTIRPPMVGPTELRTSKTSILPGDMTYEDVREGHKGFRPAYQFNFPIEQMEHKQEQLRERISKAYYEQLFLMLANAPDTQKTATEIVERREEKFLALGPVLEQLNQDSNDPLIDLAFEFHVRQRLIPPPPEELQGVDLKVEYVSIMAQAQKLAGLSSIERFAGFANGVITADPSARHKVDVEQMLDVYADTVSLPGGIVRSDEDTHALKQQEAEAQQAQQKAEMMQAGVGVAKDLSGVDMSTDTALTRLLQQSKAGQMAEQ